MVAVVVVLLALLFLGGGSRSSREGMGLPPGTRPPPAPPPPPGYVPTPDQSTAQAALGALAGLGSSAVGAFAQSVGKGYFDSIGSAPSMAFSNDSAPDVSGNQLFLGSDPDPLEYGVYGVDYG